MATPKHSGFEAPTIGGPAYPKGSTIKKNSDGTITIIPPKQKDPKKKPVKK